jgi:hypothetical protein
LGPAVPEKKMLKVAVNKKPELNMAAMFFDDRSR